MADPGAEGPAMASTAPPAVAMPSQQGSLVATLINAQPDFSSSVVAGPNSIEPTQTVLKRQPSSEPGYADDDLQGDRKRAKIEDNFDNDDMDMGWGDIGKALESALFPLSTELGSEPPKFDVPAADAPAATHATPAVLKEPADVKKDASLESANQTRRGSLQGQKKMKFSQNPTYIMRSMGLPLLGSLAIQILHLLSERPRSVSLADAEASRVYQSLRTAFCSVRQMFSDSLAILLPDELDIKELGDIETIQMANMATICASVYEADDVSLTVIHDHFLMTFLPESGVLSEDLAKTFLSLKLRTLAHEFQQPSDEKQRSDFLENLFPANLEEQLKQLHLDTPLSDQEKAFMKDTMASKSMLLEAAKTEESRRELTLKFPMESFRDELITYLTNHSDDILHYAETHNVEMPAEDELIVDDHDQSMTDTPFSVLDASDNAAAEPLSIAPKGQQADPSTSDGPLPSAPTFPSTAGLSQFIKDAVEKSTAAAQTTSTAAHASGTSTTGTDRDLSGLADLIRERLSQEPPTYAVDTKQKSPVVAANDALTSMQNTYASNIALCQGRTPSFSFQTTQPPPSAPPVGSSSSLPPNQSSPSSVLYERARQATAAKTTAHARREGLHSTRRPWSAEEEQALMVGLDTVKGPHWSQILQLFGVNGTISNILKERSQVQLKDKARNLKLFFLKANSEMPYYLRCVTGELKTRAPSQAARRAAAEESNRKGEQARVQTIMTLAGGLQDKSQAVSPATTQPMAAAAAAGTTAGPPRLAQAQPPSGAAMRLPGATVLQPTAVQAALNAARSSFTSIVGSASTAMAGQLTTAGLSSAPQVSAALLATTSASGMSVAMPALAQQQIRPQIPLPVQQQQQQIQQAHPQVAAPIQHMTPAHMHQQLLSRTNAAPQSLAQARPQVPLAQMQQPAQQVAKSSPNPVPQTQPPLLPQAQQTFLQPLQKPQQLQQLPSQTPQQPQQPQTQAQTQTQTQTQPALPSSSEAHLSPQHQHEQVSAPTSGTPTATSTPVESTPATASATEASHAQPVEDTSPEAAVLKLKAAFPM